MEEWRKVAEFGGRTYGDTYEVSNFGQVRNWKTGRAKKCRVGARGYLMTNLDLGGKKYTVFVHRLVAFTFLEHEPFPGATVDHINRNALDNRVENLRWADGHRQWENSERNSRTYLERLHKKRARLDAEIAELEKMRNYLHLGPYSAKVEEWRKGLA